VGQNVKVCPFCSPNNGHGAVKSRILHICSHRTLYSSIPSFRERELLIYYLHFFKSTAANGEKILSFESILFQRRYIKISPGYGLYLTFQTFLAKNWRLKGWKCIRSVLCNKAIFQLVIDLEKFFSNLLYSGYAHPFFAIFDSE
jgi:hypothetical protein